MQRLCTVIFHQWYYYQIIEGITDGTCLEFLESCVFFLFERVIHHMALGMGILQLASLPQNAEKHTYSAQEGIFSFSL